MGKACTAGPFQLKECPFYGHSFVEFFIQGHFWCMERVERGHLSTARSEEEKEEAGEREGFMEPIIEFKNLDRKSVV